MRTEIEYAISRYISLTLNAHTHVCGEKNKGNAMNAIRFNKD